MKIPLRILHIEDSWEDAYLIEHAIAENGIDALITLVRSEAEFMCAMDRTPFDVILSDSGVPGFNVFKALKSAREKCPGITFICVSGTNDPRCVEKSLAAGATDYIPKDELSRLVTVLRQEREKPHSPSE
ncbi:MAG TPA: response regulator [Verrucomicrobiae bacterium]